MLNHSLDELHLFLGVLHDSLGLIRLAAETIGGHYHAEIVRVHFGDGDVVGGGEDLEELDEVGEDEPVDGGQFVVDDVQTDARLFAVRDALVVELVRDEWLVKLPVPEFEE